MKFYRRSTCCYIERVKVNQYVTESSSVAIVRIALFIEYNSGGGIHCARHFRLTFYNHIQSVQTMYASKVQSICDLCTWMLILYKQAPFTFFGQPITLCKTEISSLLSRE